MTKTRRPWAAPFAVGLALRALLPWYSHGFRYMDEHWQVIEPANFLIHGFWSKTHEWEQGGRSWIYPWLVSLPMRAAELVGIHDPLWIAAAAKFAHGLASALAVPLVYLALDSLLKTKVRSRLGYDKTLEPDVRTRAALWAAWFVALWPFALYCGLHTHGEMLGALFVLLGAAAPLLLKNDLIAFAVSGLGFGLALSLKIDVAVAGLGFGLWQLGAAAAAKDPHRALRRSLALIAGVLPFVLLVGLVDRLTWGHWFNSVLGHARVNLVEGIGNQWGVSPWYQHVIYYFDLAGPPSLAAFCALPWLWRKLPDALKASWFMNAFFVAVYATIPHKEKRFISPLIYTAQLTAFATLAYAWSSWRPKLKARHARLALSALVAITAIQGAANAYAYVIHRAWWDRIGAMHTAGEIPGIQKMLSPQWPAVFYLPRHVPAEVTGTDRESLEKATRGLTVIGVATDWQDLGVFEKLGFKCEGWPGPAPKSPRKDDPVPWAYKCVRTKTQ